MYRGRIAVLLVFLVLTTATAAFAGKPRSCVTAGEASKMLNKDVCVSAHVYDVVRLDDGTRFLDVCPPDMSDEACRFTIVSFWRDYDTVGELARYRGTNVKVRGIVLPMNGRAGIVVSHVRQFNGGAPKFTPNPLLAKGFDAEQSWPPVSDPNLRRHGGRRAFMDYKNQEPLPAK